MDGRKKEDEETAVNEFIEHFNSIKNTRYEILEWPDKTKSGDVDAIAKYEDKYIAIEHTTIDTFARQREDDAGFVNVFGKLEKELKNEFDGFVTLTVPVGAVKSRHDQDRIKNIIKKWLLENVPRLSYGAVVEPSISGVDFKLRIRKNLSANRLFGVERFAPDENDEGLSKRLADFIKRKSKKLIPYEDKNYYTVLLIQNNDIALMSPQKMREAFGVAMQENPINIDEIWHMDSSFGPEQFEFYQLWPVTESHSK